jgi:hypothetical protein
MGVPYPRHISAALANQRSQRGFVDSSSTAISGRVLLFTSEVIDDTLPRMTALLLLRNVYWTITVGLEVLLLVYFLRQKRYLGHPAFFCYIALIIFQSGVLAAAFHYLGENSKPTYWIGWASQGVVICARWLAVIEIAKRTLAKYSGIWALVTRIFLVVSVGVLVYAVLSSGSAWNRAILNADRALELCIATFIVCMFLFVRYYRVDMDRFETVLAVGFCLYSCSQVINDSIFEGRPNGGGLLWTYLHTLAFLASLLLWLGAVRTSSAASHMAHEKTVEAESYEELSQKLNSRLHLLNNRLNRLFRSEDSHL